jgi:hypothetical protein
MLGTYLYRAWDRAHHPVDAAARAPGYLATWLAEFPGSEPAPPPSGRGRDPHPTCDFEDWAENAVLLHEARLRGLPLEVLDQAPQYRVSTSGWMTPRSTPGAPVGAMLGGWANADFLRGLPVPLSLVGQDEAAVDAASDYAASPVFQRHAGRRAIYADATGESIEQALDAILGDRAEADVFVKTVRKESSGIVRLARADGPLYSQFCEQWDGFEWEVVRFEGHRRLLLVQEAIECRHEYRFFVVGGRLVTGAGCVELHTPLDGTETFDAKTEPVRNRSEVGSFPEVRDRHLAFAKAFVEEFAAEHGRDLDYCLDVCLDGSGRTVVIELNPPLNCGRYASDVGAWMDAVVARTEAHANLAAPGDDA